MGTFWKALIGLAIAVPLAAYVVGPLTPSDSDNGDRSRPVIVGEVGDAGRAAAHTLPDTGGAHRR